MTKKLIWNVYYQYRRVTIQLITCIFNLSQGKELLERLPVKLNFFKNEYFKTVLNEYFTKDQLDIKELRFKIDLKIFEDIACRIYG